MLETTRLILRPGILSDAPLLMELNSDPEVVRYTGDVGFMNIVEAENIVKERLIPQFEKYKMGRFQVFLKDGTYLGWCGLRYFPEKDEVDLGYRFMKKFWGKGYATEASLACLEYGFNTLGLKRICAEAMPENIDSIKVMQKLKMTFRGIHRNECDSTSYILYDITSEEYNRCKES